MQSFHAGQPAQHYSISAQPSGSPVADADKQTVRDFVELGLQAVRASDGFTNVYMDFVEIVSPGLFPEGNSPERHLEGPGGDFKQRNLNIAQALFRSGMIEQYGTVIPRIKGACDASGVAFSYRQDVKLNRDTLRASRGTVRCPG